MTVSRRFFLFGSAAAVASAAVPLSGVVDRSSILLAPSDRLVGLRKMYRLMFEADSYGGPPLMIEVTRKGRGSTGLPILSMAVAPGGRFQWWALPGEEIYLPERHALSFSVTPDPGLNARLEVRYQDRDGTYFTEEFVWRDGVVTAMGYWTVFA